MIVIGVTGGIASGKSTVARMLATHGAAHVDADRLVHRLLAHDRETIAAIAQQWPEAVTHGVVDRRALGAALAKDPAALTRLETLLHPRVRAAEERAIRQATHQRRRAVILDVPLLFETGSDMLCDTVIAVTAPLAMRRRRALARGMSLATVDRLIARQLDDATRNALADLVIPSTLGKAEMHRQLRKWL